MVISARGNGVKNRLGTIEIMSASANRDLEPTIRPCLKSLNRQIGIGTPVKEAYMNGYDWMLRSDEKVGGFLLYNSSRFQISAGGQ